MSNTEDDERCVMVQSKVVKWDDASVEIFQRDRVATYGAKYQDLVVSGYNGKYQPRKVGEGLIHSEDSDYCKSADRTAPPPSRPPRSECACP
jgi:hypothetical protein